MSKSFRNDLTGRRFNRLTVIGFVPTPNPHSYWRCKCDCGKEVTVLGFCLTNGGTKSCGCFNSDIHSEMFKKMLYKHGQAYTRLYNVWKGMISRCYNPKTRFYHSYGGRGITVCDEWKNDVIAFRDWALENGYTEEKTIDRINNDGDYEPNNCRWVDNKTQARNTSKNVYIKHEGKRICLSELAEIYGLKADVVIARYHRGDRGERLVRPIKK